MKKFFFTAVFLFSLIIFPSGTFGQSIDNHTAREEAEGRKIWEKLQSKQLDCKNLTDNNYDSLGEYFMGRSIGNTQRHELMNQMMTNMMGEEGEKQMHIVMGKRFCDGGFLPMTWMMGGGGNPMMGFGGWNNMMGNAWGLFNGFTWFLIIVFLVLGVIYFWKGINKSDRK